MLIEPAESEILKYAFDDFVKDPDRGVYIKTFEIKYLDDLDVINRLEKLGLLKKNNHPYQDYYQVPLVALKFFPVTGIANIILGKVSQTYEYVKLRYIENPDEDILFSDVLGNLGLAETNDGSLYMNYFRDLHVWSSWSDTSFKASSEIIKNSFKDILVREVKMIERKVTGEASAQSRFFKNLPNRKVQTVISQERWKAVDLYPEQVNKLFGEVYKAKGSGCTALPSMGLRAIVERVGSEKVGDCNFKQIINGLIKQGFIQGDEKKAIESVVEFGHASAHRGHFPSEKDLEDGIAIVQHLVEKIYGLEKRTNNLTKSTPKRK